MVFFQVGISAALTTADTALTVNSPITGLGRQILTRYGASHDTLSVRVTALARQKSNRAIKQAFAQISV